MPGFQTKKLGWFRTPSAYESMTAWREKRAQMREKFEAQQTTLVNAFAGALTTNGDAANQIILQAALERVQAEVKAKAEKAMADAALDTTVDTGKADLKDSAFSGSGSAELDSGTKVNLDSGTITLSNGVVIDAKTGVKKVNIVT